MSLSAILVILLAAIAAWVSVRQYRHGDRKAGLTWMLIVLYWVVLTAKNLADLYSIMSATQ